jgi:DNA-binding CsgD family transcriptional regulator
MAHSQYPSANKQVPSAESVLRAQRELRKLLFDRSDAIRWRPGRELAARLLLTIDEPLTCWALSVEFLRGELGVERVDGGFASHCDRIYIPAMAEARSDRGDIPSLSGMKVNNQGASAQHIWRKGRPLAHPDMAEDTTFDATLRRHFLSIGTRAKMTSSIWWQGRPVGLICADRMSARRAWNRGQLDCFESIVQDVMAPTLFEAKRLSMPRLRSLEDAWGAAVAERLRALSAAEMRVCKLVSHGMSYKEIAFSIDRSFSTVDHHLRSIREKLQVRSTIQLVKMLSGADLS